MCVCTLLFYVLCLVVFFFFKQKTAYEMRISDWSSDVCSSDLLGAQAHQFLHVHEAVLEDRLVDDADAFGDAVHGHELRLHVGGETRMRRGDDVHRLRPAPAHVDGDAVAAGADVGAGLDQLVEHRVEGAGARVGRSRERAEEHTSELQATRGNVYS